jgi:hypothetical protein
VSSRQKLIILFLLSFAANSFRVEGQLNTIIEKISEYNQAYPEEILYMHVDREVYNPGDTLWFKTYLRHKVTLEENTLSKTVFVKLLNRQGFVVHESIHPVFESESLGQFEIEEGLASGYYQLICYSSWMKNGDYERLYRKTIRIQEEALGKESFTYRLNRERYVEGDTIHASLSFLDKSETEVGGVQIRYRTRRPGGLISRGSLETMYGEEMTLIVDKELVEAPEVELSASYKGYYFDSIVSLPILGKFDLGIYPEGGTLVEGLSNRIAFKVHSETGIPFEVEGGLYTEEGEKLEDIASDHLGMGSFMLVPETGKSYYLEVNQPVQGKERYYLPEIQKEGWVLQANYRDPNLIVTLNHTFADSKRALITLSVRDFMLRYSIKEVNGFDSFHLPCADLPPGIAVITLFDEQLRPQAERLVFINHERISRVDMETEFESYLPRDSVRLKLKVTDYRGVPLSGSFSLSVVDEQLCMSSVVDEPNIVSSYLLSSEIKGHIQDPAYYFEESDPDHRYRMDLLLLTQGWRRYRYDHILDADEFEEGFDPYFKVRADSIFFMPHQTPKLQVDFQDQYTLGLNNKWLEEVTVHGRRNQRIEFVEETFVNSSTATEQLITSSPDVFGSLLNMGLPVREERGEGGEDILIYEAYPRGPAP